MSGLTGKHVENMDINMLRAQVSHNAHKQMLVQEAPFRQILQSQALTRVLSLPFKSRLLGEMDNNGPGRLNAVITFSGCRCLAVRRC
jgi:hypothetical protein